jgi:hypothetical protein
MTIEHFVCCVEIFPDGLPDNERAYFVQAKERMWAGMDVADCPVFPRLEKGECESINVYPVIHGPLGIYYEVRLTFAHPIRISPPKRKAWWKRIYGFRKAQ